RRNSCASSGYTESRADNGNTCHSCISGGSCSVGVDGGLSDSGCLADCPRLGAFAFLERGHLLEKVTGQTQRCHLPGLLDLRQLGLMLPLERFLLRIPLGIQVGSLRAELVQHLQLGVVPRLEPFLRLVDFQQFTSRPADFWSKATELRRRRESCFCHPAGHLCVFVAGNAC